MVIQLRCSTIPEKMPASDATQAINVQSLGRLAHQGSRSPPKLQETQVFLRVFEVSAAITVLGTNTELLVQRQSRRQCVLQGVMLQYL